MKDKFPFKLSMWSIPLYFLSLQIFSFTSKPKQMRKDAEFWSIMFVALGLASGFAILIAVSSSSNIDPLFRVKYRISRSNFRGFNLYIGIFHRLWNGM